MCRESITRRCSYSSHGRVAPVGQFRSKRRSEFSSLPEDASPPAQKGVPLPPAVACRCQPAYGREQDSQEMDANQAENFFADLMASHEQAQREAEEKAVRRGPGSWSVGCSR